MQEIAVALRAYRFQEERLLSQLQTSKNQPNPVAQEVTKSLIGELAATAAEELFGLPSLGRKAGRALVTQGNKQSQRAAVQAIENQHNTNVAGVLNILSEVSEKTPNLRQPNSHKLKRGINQAQGFARLETRIRKTIVELQHFETVDLLYNRNLPVPREEAARIIDSLPRISELRAMLPETEPRLRLFIRSSLRECVGPNWLSVLEEKFQKAYPRWIAKAKAKGSSDPLGGQTLGELIQIIRSVPELNKLVTSKPEFHLSLTILSSARSTLIHPLGVGDKDIQDEEFQKTKLALQTVIESTKSVTK